MTSVTHYATRLHDAVNRTGTAALVGLDPRWEQLPPDVVAAAERRNTAGKNALIATAFEEFCCRIIDVVREKVSAVKPQSAFFEEYGPEGTAALGRVIRHARQAGLIVICDAKRGDIGTTAEAYARGYLAGADVDAAPWGADALTVNPFLGPDTLEPFVKVAGERGAGIYVLVRTSNPGAGQFQDRPGDSIPLYREMGDYVESLSRKHDNGEGYGFVGAVVGATCPEELVELRRRMPHVPLLVPGYGAQGGGAKEVAPAFDFQGLGALVNNSRGINFAYLREPYKSRFSPQEWERAVLAATEQMIEDLKQARDSAR